MRPDLPDTPVLFDVALQRWQESAQCTVRILLARLVGVSVVHDRMVHNLLAETQFTAADVDALLGLLHALAASGAEIPEICARLKQFCVADDRGERRTLRGRPAQIGRAVLGRVCGMSRFARLLAQAEHHTDEQEARAAIRAMLQTQPENYPQEWQRYPLGRHAMWSTLDETGGRPFRDARSAGELLGLLGLDPHQDGEVLLLFEYRLPAEVVSRVPSFFDAYVAEWNAWFRVSAHEAPFGRTRPVGDREARGVPEVIHDVITASALAALGSLA